VDEKPNIIATTFQDSMSLNFTMLTPLFNTSYLIKKNQISWVIKSNKLYLKYFAIKKKELNLKEYFI